MVLFLVEPFGVSNACHEQYAKLILITFCHSFGVTEMPTVRQPKHFPRTHSEHAAVFDQVLCALCQQRGIKVFILHSSSYAIERGVVASFSSSGTDPKITSTELEL